MKKLIDLLVKLSGWKLYDENCRDTVPGLPGLKGQPFPPDPMKVDRAAIRRRESEAAAFYRQRTNEARIKKGLAPIP